MMSDVLAVMRWAGSLVANADVARLGEETHGFEAAFAAHARTFHAAHRSAQVAQHPGVDPDQAGFELRRDTVAARHVATPQGYCQSVSRAVCDGERLGLAVERQERGH